MPTLQRRDYDSKPDTAGKAVSFAVPSPEFQFTNTELRHFGVGCAIAVMLFIFIGLVVMWYPSNSELSGEVGAGSMLVVCLLAAGELVSLAPAVFVMLRSKLFYNGVNSKSWTISRALFVVGLLLTLLGIALGPISLMWISNLSETQAYLRSVLLGIYFLAPMIGLASLLMGMYMALQMRGESAGRSV